MALGRNISPGQGVSYYEKDDYYLEREGGAKHALEWGGKLAREMGLSGKADPGVWKEALHGRFPGGIAVEGGGFKDPETGELQKRAGTDFEFSAPKSVSIQVMVFGDDGLLAAHRESAAEALAFLEEQVGARRGHAGKNWETTGRGLIGRVTHFTNREGEPHLHDHGVFLNVTKNSDGQVQAMTNDRQMHLQRLAQEVYHAGLVRRGIALGYEWEKGIYGEPQLKGYTRETIERFSGRGAQIEAYIKEKWGVDWRTLSREERNASRHMHEEAWKMTRKAKSVSEREGLTERWKAEARAIGVEKILPGKPGKGLPKEARRRIAREALAFAVDHHTERESAVGDGELLRTALAAGRGRIRLADLTEAMEAAVASGELIRQTAARAGPKPALVTSRAALSREKRILRMEREGRGAVEPIMNPFQAEAAIERKEIENGIRYSAEQKGAMRQFLTSDSRFIGVNGFAGTGKTTLWKPCVEIAKEAGYDVIGVSPQHSGKDALKDSFEIFRTALGIDAVTTVRAWLGSGNAGPPLGERTIVVLDEAGLASAATAESVMKRIGRAGARGALSGDKLQYEPVEAGPAFRMLQAAGMETAFVTEMQRQKNAPEHVREAAAASVSDPARALEWLKTNIVEVRTPEERIRALAGAWLESENSSDTLVLTGTRSARDAVNARVREARGLAGTGRDYRVFRREYKTVAELKKTATYEPGIAIRFSQDYPSLGVKSGAVVPVVGVDEDRGTIRLEMPGGRVRDVAPHRLSGEGWEVGRTESLEFSPGDRMKITGNALKKEGVTNGMKGEVREVSATCLRVRLDNGKEAEISVGAAPLEIDHGYAQTGYSAQGLAAQTVILDLPAGSPATHRRSFYTNLTRTRNAVRIFTDDRKKLTGAVVREKDKTLAHDVERENGSDRRPSSRDRERSRREDDRAGRRPPEIPERAQEERDSAAPGKESRGRERFRDDGRGR